MTISEIYDGRFGDILMREYLAKIGLSKRRITAVKLGGIFLNGNAVTVRATIKTNDKIDIIVPNKVSDGIVPMELNIKVIYEDDDLLAVYKPPNMPTHPSRGNTLPTLANGIMAMYSGNFVFRAITRLDRDTSGIVLIAKDQRTAAKLSEEMKRGNIEKTYEALLSCTPENHNGVIEAPIEREAPDSIKRIVRDDGKRAITEYHVKEILPDGKAICKVNPITGRTHQIRVHMAYIGAPLYADFLYGEKIEGENYHLRCVSLSFTHPHKNEKITINA